MEKDPKSTVNIVRKTGMPDDAINSFASKYAGLALLDFQREFAEDRSEIEKTLKSLTEKVPLFWERVEHCDAQAPDRKSAIRKTMERYPHEINHRTIAQFNARLLAFNEDVADIEPAMENADQIIAIVKNAGKDINIIMYGG